IEQGPLEEGNPRQVRRQLDVRGSRLSGMDEIEVVPRAIRDGVLAAEGAIDGVAKLVARTLAAVGNVLVLLAFEADVEGGKERVGDGPILREGGGDGGAADSNASGLAGRLGGGGRPGRHELEDFGLRGDVRDGAEALVLNAAVAGRGVLAAVAVQKA